MGGARYLVEPLTDGGAGCNEASLNLTVNNACTYEASNCFGQNIAGNRHLWVYVAP